MCDARMFAPQIEHFSADRPVLTFPLTGQATITDLAEDILAIAPSSFALAGLSMGGITAMEIVRRAPQRVSRLALLDTNHLSESNERVLAREPQIDRVLNGGLRTVMRDEMKPNYLADGPLKQTILDLCMTMAEALGPSVFIDQSRALQQRSDQLKHLNT